MKQLSDQITSFSSIEELANYSAKKYNKPLSFKNATNADKFTENNQYIIISVLIRYNPEGVYRINHELFHKEDKGFVLGTLNRSRDYIINRISTIYIEDGYIDFEINEGNQFRSFELGIMIDPLYEIYEKRARRTMVDFLVMLGSCS